MLSAQCIVLNRKVTEIRTFLFIVGFGLGLYGCAGIFSVVEFEVLEPANVSFPDHVSQLLVMNRAPLTFDAFSKEDRQGLKTEHLIVLDTLISNNLFRGLKDVLQQSPIERFHLPLWLSERRTDTALLDDLILTRREVNEICGRHGGDALISLELYSMDVDEHYQYYSDAPVAVQNHYFQIANQIKWLIYLPENPRPFDTYSTIDTIYFTDILDGQYQPTPNMIGMISEAFYNSGLKYGRYLVPVWTNTSRNLYRGREDSLKKASKMTGKGKWNQAYGIWRNLVESGDSTLVAKSFHNMAIYYELEDNLDSASILVNKALKYDSLDVIKYYREELDVRLLNRMEVLEQVR